MDFWRQLKIHIRGKELFDNEVPKEDLTSVYTYLFSRWSRSFFFLKIATLEICPKKLMNSVPIN